MRRSSLVALVGVLLIALAFMALTSTSQPVRADSGESCVACHTNKDLLMAMVTPREVHGETGVG